MNLKKEIEGWDGKSSSDIDAIYVRHAEESSFYSTIIESTGNADLQKGATWLLKRHLEEGHALDAIKCTALIKLLLKQEHWESKLHMLQCFPYMNIGKAEKNKAVIFLRNCLVDDNKFVRAWAYNGFYEISLQYPEYKNETKQLFEMAMRDEAPSVKARIRNIVKNGF